MDEKINHAYREYLDQQKRLREEQDKLANRDIAYQIRLLDREMQKALANAEVEAYIRSQKGM